MRQFLRFFLLVSFINGCTWCGIERYSRTELLMGTFVEIKVAAKAYSRRELKMIVDGAFEEIAKAEHKFSIFDPESEVNKLNTAGTMDVSRDLFDLAEKAIENSRVTDGAFDVTVSPILKKKGFYKHMPKEIFDRVPEEFNENGWKNIKMRSLERNITLENNAWIDFSGIAKGYIVDSAVDYFRIKNIPEFLINAGGDIYCGPKIGLDAWRVGIRKPGSNGIIMTLNVRETAVVTSGDYENVIIDETTGDAMSHIIDPLSKEPKKETFSSVTVLAGTTSRADALATGMMVMGGEKAIALADKIEGVEIITIERVPGQKEKIRFSKSARKYINAG